MIPTRGGYQWSSNQLVPQIILSLDPHRPVLYMKNVASDEVLETCITIEQPDGEEMDDIIGVK